MNAEPPLGLPEYGIEKAFVLADDENKREIRTAGFSRVHGIFLIVQIFVSLRFT